MDLMYYANKIVRSDRNEAIIKTHKKYKTKVIPQMDDVSDILYIKYSGKYRKTFPMINIRDIVDIDNKLVIESVVTRYLTFLSERSKFINMEVKLDA